MQRLQVRAGDAVCPPSSEDPELIAKRQFLDLVLPDSIPGCEARKATLNFWLNGRSLGSLEHYGLTKCDHIASEVAAALLPKAIPLFPRHRWCTSRQTFAEFALLAALCDGDLLQDAVRLWLGKPTSRYDDMGRWHLMLALGDVGASEELTWVERAAQQRADASEWVSTRPGQRLLMMVITMGSQITLISNFLHRGS